jgi:16S rRNA processing protein RimM
LAGGGRESADARSGKVTIGRISGLFGVKGWLKVQSYTDPRENIMNYNPWLLRLGEEWQTFDVEAVQTHGKSIIAKLRQVVDRDEAAGLLRSEIAIKREQLPALAENEYYWRDLQGLTVLNLAGVVLGKVEYLLETGANDVLVVRQDEREILIPYAPGEIVHAVDLANREMRVDWEADY